MTDNEALKLAVQMHQEFNALETNLNLEFELHTHMWLRTDCEIYENTDDNKVDLLEYEGNTYNWEICYISYEDDDFLLACVDNGCGDKYVALFLKENQLYEDCE